MQKSLRKNRKGMSYAEVTVSFLVASLFILPIYSTFIGATGTLQETRSIQQSTLYTETLLDNIKWKLEKDIEVAHEVAYNRSNETPAYYLNENVAPEVQKAAHSFEEVFSYLGENSEDIMNQLYNTERYAYEVAIWDLDEMLKDATTLDANTQMRTIGFGSVNKAVKWYSNPQYILDKYYHDSILPTFSITEELASIFNGDTYLTAYTQNSGNASPISGVSVVTLGAENGEIVITNTQNYGTMTTSEGYDLLEGSTEVGTGYTIVSSDTDTSNRGLVILDTRGIDFKSTALTSTLLRIKNTSDMPILIKVLTSEANMATIDQFVQLLCADTISGNRINVEYVQNITLENSYLIGIVVRDLSPALGKGGKVIKTMFDIYSYAPRIS